MTKYGAITIQAKVKTKFQNFPPYGYSYISLYNELHI
jgi:hypothetical protein